jgi:DNA-binding MarR family transcriptional regulator
LNGNTTLPAKSPAGGKHTAPSLSPIELRAVRFIARYRRLEGYAPSTRDIAEAIGISPGGAQKLVARLIKKGVVDRGAPRTPRSLVVICDLRELEAAVGVGA